MKKNKDREGMRVKMVIYSDTDENIVSSDEPFYNDDDEMAHQAYRLLEKLEAKLHGDEMVFGKPENAGGPSIDE